MPCFESRRRLLSRIVRFLRAEQPATLCEISIGVRANPETVKTAVKAAVRKGTLVLAPDQRPTRWGPAKQYTLPDVAVIDPTWDGAGPPLDTKIEALQQVLSRWATWTVTKAADVPERDRVAYWAIESAVRAMPPQQAIALLHVHGCAVWVFRRMDMAELYREALTVVSRRVESLMAIR